MHRQDNRGSDCQLLEGDCLEKLKELEADSIDLIVTDPPYGYSFMGIEREKEHIEIAKKRINNGNTMQPKLPGV